MGGASQTGTANLLTPEQQQFLSSIYGSANPLAGNAFAQFLQPLDQQSMQDAFQKGVVDPSMKTFNQQIVPAIQQRFVDANAGSSSALNQALSQSAQDLSTSLGGQYLNFMQGQQGNTLNALGQLGNLTGQRAFSPIVTQQAGVLGPLLGALGQLGAGFFMSSEKVKENIRDYHRGLDLIEALDVKQYDYIPSQGGSKDRVGIIAETLPEELTGQVNGIKAVDVYGLVGVLINSVKELSARLEQVEAAHDNISY
jgi:hypothetical protein